MHESFEIEVSYKGETYSFDGNLVQYGYTHRIVVSVNDSEIWFEPDEERNYRAVADTFESINLPKKFDVGLLQAIAEKIESIVK